MRHRLVGMFATAVLAVSGLAGCAGVPSIMLGVMEVGGAASPKVTDDYKYQLKLVTPVDGDRFISDMSSIAKESGYIVKSTGRDGGSTGVLLMKETTGAGVVIGREGRLQAAINLMPDGLTLHVHTHAWGNDGAAKPGAAKEMAEDFEKRISARLSMR